MAEVGVEVVIVNVGVNVRGGVHGAQGREMIVSRLL